ncbi:lysophospholipase L1-like esterase [Blastococcus xanthinilyticus]|uniref:Lysophospholipase L1-like esterase n=1 Tax=Blastococcus xanthinilyticus TaxID=1564164 RepID=A0A5S5D7Q7_9ACTN|nr:lysophospholipase L1-like esterase [Blastococcus xanthinilyticus]
MLVGTAIAADPGAGPEVQSVTAQSPVTAAQTPAVTERPPAVEQERQEPSSVVFLGDSWTAGYGASDRHGYPELTGEALGWDYDVLGVGGSGYTLVGGGGAGSTYAERIGQALATGSDVIVVQGSLNERIGEPGALAPAARDTLARLAAQKDADTRVLVLGASYNPGTPAGTIDDINDDIEAAADAAGLRFVDVAAQNWTDPADPTIWFDPIHPNDAGHRLIADRLAELLRDLAEH